MTVSAIIDKRVQRFLEKESGYPTESFPTDGIELRQSSARKDSFNNRLRIFRLGNGAVATGTLQTCRVIESLIASITIWELFSPVGRFLLERALDPYPVWSTFDYFLRDQHALVLPDMPDSCRKLPSLPDTIPADSDLPYPPLGQESFGAFGIYRSEKLVASSAISCRHPGIVQLSVTTDEGFRGKGFGASVVAAATTWVLDRAAIAHYSVYSSNIPSLLLVRKLGFCHHFQTIGA